MKNQVLHWLKQVLVAFDQFLNSLIGGWADETFSARCWRLRDHPVWGRLRLVVDALLFFDKNHCEESHKSEVLRLQSPPATRPPAAHPQETAKK